MYLTNDRKAQKQTARALYPTRRNPIVITAASFVGRATWSANNESHASISYSSEVLSHIIWHWNKITFWICFYYYFVVRPDPPSNCSILNQTADAVEVWCRPGFDGGHPQLFQFEIFDTQSAVLLYNKSGRYPHLRVGNLDSGIKLYIQISAFNQRGRSPLVPLEAYTIKIADKQTGEQTLS